MQQNQRGFTPVHLLIVVAILGILAATVTPQYADAPMPTPAGSADIASASDRFIIGAYP